MDDERRVLLHVHRSGVQQVEHKLFGISIEGERGYAISLVSAFNS